MKTNIKAKKKSTPGSLAGLAERYGSVSIAIGEATKTLESLKTFAVYVRNIIVEPMPTSYIVETNSDMLSPSLSDQRFVEELGEIVSMNNGVNRLGAMAALLRKWRTAREDWSRKEDKLTDRIKRVDRLFTAENGENHENPEYTIANRKRQQVRETLVVIDKRIAEVARRFMIERSKILHSVLNYTDALYKSFESEKCIRQAAAKNGIVDTIDSIIKLETSYLKGLYK